MTEEAAERIEKSRRAGYLRMEKALREIALAIPADNLAYARMKGCAMSALLYIGHDTESRAIVDKLEAAMPRDSRNEVIEQCAKVAEAHVDSWSNAHAKSAVRHAVTAIRALSHPADGRPLPDDGAADVFTPAQVARLWHYQFGPWNNPHKPDERPDLPMRMHPFTCANRTGHPKIAGDHGILVPTTRGWICPICDYTQNWAHDFMSLPAPPVERSEGT